MDAGVSRGTLVEAISPPPPRRYRSPVRMGRRETTEAALIEVALAEMGRGNFRPSGKVLASLAGFRNQSVVNDRFGSLALMRRRLARERWETIAALAGLERLTRPEQRRLVWLIMTGAPEPRWPEPSRTGDAS